MRSRAGFTLIELLIFMAIFAVAIGAFMGVFTDVARVAVRQSSMAEVQSQSQFLLQTIQHYVERSSMVSTTVDQATSALILRMPDPAEDPTVISLNGTALQLKVGAAATQAVTSNKVQVSNLNFTRRSNPGGKDAVAVSFTVSYATNNQSQRFSTSLRTSVARVSAATFDSEISPGSGNGGNYVLGTSAGHWRSINDTIFFNGSNVGISDNAFAPSARLHVQGNVLVERDNLYTDSSSDGVVLKSPGGFCWRLNVDRSGVIGTESVACL